MGCIKDKKTSSKNMIVGSVLILSLLMLCLMGMLLYLALMCYLEPAVEDGKKEVDNMLNFGLKYAETHNFLEDMVPIVLVTGRVPQPGHTSTIRLIVYKAA